MTGHSKSHINFLSGKFIGIISPSKIHSCTKPTKTSSLLLKKFHAERQTLPPALMMRLPCSQLNHNTFLRTEGYV